MKRVVFLTFLSLSVGCFTLSAQESISAEKRKLIAEITTATKSEKITKETFQALLNQLNEAYPEIVKSVLEKNTNYSAVQRKRIEAEVIKRSANLNSKFIERLFQRVNMKEYVEQANNLLYDKFFSEDELRDLLAFFRSSTGQKYTDVTPQLMMESARVMQELLYPKIRSAAEEVVNEDIKETQKQMSLPK